MVRKVLFWVAWFLMLPGLQLPSAEAPDPRAEAGAILQGSGAAITALAVSSQGAYFASGDSEGTVRLYAGKENQELWNSKKMLSGGIQSLLFDPQENFLYCLGNDGTLSCLDLAAPNKPPVRGGPFKGAQGLWWSPDGRFLLTAPTEGGLETVNRMALSLGRPFKCEGSSQIRAVLPLRDGHLVFSEDSGRLALADLTFGVLHSVTLSAAALDLAVIKDQGEVKYVCALLTDGSAVFLDLKTFEIKKRLDLALGHFSEGMLSEGVKQALLIDGDGAMKAFRLPVGTSEGDSQLPLAPTCAALSFDGNRAIFGGADGSARLWKHPGARARFIRLLDVAEAQLQGGHPEMAAPKFAEALGLFQEPAVREELEKAKQARLDQAQQNRDRMRALSGGSNFKKKDE